MQHPKTNAHIVSSVSTGFIIAQTSYFTMIMKTTVAIWRSSFFWPSKENLFFANQCKLSLNVLAASHKQFNVKVNSNSTNAHFHDLSVSLRHNVNCLPNENLDTKHNDVTNASSEPERLLVEQQLDTGCPPLRQPDRPGLCCAGNAGTESRLECSGRWTALC